MICPRCGELLIVRPDQDSRTLTIPRHEDVIEPGTRCTASLRCVRDGVLL